MLQIIAGILAKGGGPARTWTLLGTSGSPRSRSESQLNPAEASLVWYISGNTTGSNNITKGYVQYDGYRSSVPADTISLTNEHAFTNQPSGWGTIYVRLTDVGTTPPDASSHAIDGTTWHTFTEDTTNIWWRQSTTSATPEVSTVKVEFASDSGGTDIIATGYYRATVTSDF